MAGLLSLPLTTSSQLVSPAAGVTYSTPTNIIVQIGAGYLISQVHLYRYRTDISGAEHREYFQVSGPLGNTNNVYYLNPSAAPWVLSCGDYDIEVTYTADGITYQSATSGKLRILTDRATINITYPTIRSVIHRGQNITIAWESMTKPENAAMLVCLLTPNGDGCFTYPELDLSNGVGVTNMLPWQVFTNQSVSNSTLELPRGEYILSVFPANEQGQAGWGSASTYFRIDDEETQPVSLSCTPSGNMVNVKVHGNQEMSRFWTLEQSSDLEHWYPAFAFPVTQGGTLSAPRTNAMAFFRAVVVP